MNSMPTSSSLSPVLKDLNYIIEENSVKTESKVGSAFGGHPTLQQRNESFDIKESMTVHCGYVYFCIHICFLPKLIGKILLP